MISNGWKWIEYGADFGPAALELVFAATLLLAVALLVNLGLRRATASLRHRVWALAMGGLLLMPLLCPLLPKFPLSLHIPLAGASPRALMHPQASKSTLAASPHEAPSADVALLPPARRVDSLPPLPASALRQEVEATPADSSQAPSLVAEEHFPDAPSWLAWSYCAMILFWVLGMVLGLVAMARTWWAERRLANSGSPLRDPAWQTLLDEIRGQLGLRGTVAVGISQPCDVPLTIGWRRPQILLPPDCSHWPVTKRWTVLVHELAHVARHDVFWQIAARLACAIYWFHPLAWLAARRLRVERELACDDAVLRCGGRPDQYAAVLLDVAAAVCHRPQTSAAAVAMACRNSVEQRIRAILQPGPSRLPVGPRTGKLLCLIAILVVVSTAALHFFASPQPLLADSSKPEKAKTNHAATKTDEAGNWKRGQVLDFRVINAKTNEPLADVTLKIYFSSGDGSNFWKKESTQTTDAQGRSKIRLPDRKPDAVWVYPSKAGFVPLRVYWRSDPAPPVIPRTVTVPLEPGTIFGAVVRNERGEPIPAVSVTVRYSEDGFGGNSHVCTNIVEKTTTDKDGCWRIGIMPANIVADDLRIFLTHPDYVSDDLKRGIIPMPITETPSIEALRAQTAVMVMHKGESIDGRVIDETGRPIAGASIYDREYYGSNLAKPVATTGKDGRFRVLHVTASKAIIGERSRFLVPTARSEKTILTVLAAGYAPELIEVEATGSAAPLEITLKHGQPVQGRVVDESGTPVKGVCIDAHRWREHNSRLNLTATTDADGKFRLTDAPFDDAVYAFHKKGYMSVDRLPMSSTPKGRPGRADYVVTLKSPLWVVGSIVDAETNKPPAKCTVIKGWDYDDGRAPQWETSIGFHVKTITDGRYRFEFTQEQCYRIRVEAEGYMPAVSRVFKPYKPDKALVIYNFKLTKAARLTGTVLGPDGKPLAGAQVFLATNVLNVRNRQVSSLYLRDSRMVRTDAAGRFVLPPEVQPFYLVVIHREGYATMTEKQFAGSQTIRIQPWAAGEDSFRVERSPVNRARATALPMSAAEKAEKRRLAKAQLPYGEKFSSKDGSLQWTVLERSGSFLTDGFTIGERIRLGQLPGYRLLMLPWVLKTLAVADEQKARLEKVRQHHQAEEAKFLRESNLHGASLTVAKAKSYYEWKEEELPRVQKQVEAILTPEQQQAYQKSQLYFNAWGFLMQRANDVKAQLTAAQSNQLQSMREAYARERKQNSQSLVEGILTVLTPQQRAKLRELALGPLGLDYHAVVTLQVQGADDPLCIYALDPYADFSKAEVQKELGLTAAQQNRVQVILGDSLTVTEKLLRELLKLSPDERNARQSTNIGYRSRIGGWAGLSPEDIRKKQEAFEEREKEDRTARWTERHNQPLMQMTVALRKQFEAMLTPAQLIAYQDMAVRQVLPFVWNDFIIRRQLGVSEEQEAQLRRIVPKGSTGDFWQTECAFGKQMLAVLTPAQREKLPRSSD
jgi:beta-lactamase regulating signal transducer with metallopeptidase domain/5-hydroxyisourate hydrolase-like protein (transthyretin family)